MGSATVTLERVAAFLDSIPKTGGTALEAQVRALVVERFRNQAPIINVEFVKTDCRSHHDCERPRAGRPGAL
jgi:hypothetical protein